MAFKKFFIILLIALAIIFLFVVGVFFSIMRGISHGR